MASSIMDSLFQRSLDDLIKSLRSPVAPPSTIILKAMDDIRRELKSTDLTMKSIALQKITYLSCLHSVDMSFASFHVVELMSSPHFSHKKIGYLAASLSFNQSTDVLLLLPNQLRKDLTSPNVCESSLALEFLSVSGTHELARELTQDIFVLLSSAKTLVRRKAIAVLLTFYDKYPDSVRVTFKRLVENLESSDPNVVSAAVGVFCELASKDPKSYLPLAPEFYRILTDSKSNWVLIKVIKIFAKLAPLEPRLTRKVVEPICEIMTKTGAKSLMFECIRAVALSLSDFDSAVKLAVEKIRELLEEEDSNLKCLGLQALTFLGEKHLWAIVENKETIIKFLSDADPNIKLEALRLLMGMVSEDNVEEITRILLKYALTSDPDFSHEILGSILATCSKQVYEIVVDFDWYVGLLGEMARNPLCKVGDEIERQMIDIGLRVKDVRPQLVGVARGLLIDPALLGNSYLYRVMAAAAWVSGEYVEFSQNPQELVEALLQPRTNLLPPLVRAIYIQSVFKVLLFLLHSYFEGFEIMGFEVSMNYEADEISNSRVECKDSAPKETFTYDSIVYLLNLIKMALEPLVSCDEVEVQERACNVVGLIQAIEEAGYEKQEGKTSQIVKLMLDALSEELGPVSLNAQERVRVPDGLTLKENLADLDSMIGDEFSLPSTFSITGHKNKQIEGLSLSEPLSKSTSVLDELRKRHGLYYLPADKDENPANDYPPANYDPVVEATRELVKLTDQSLTTKKLNRVKPRPMVVKLDDGDEAPVVKVVRDSKDDLLSGAVRDLLLSDELNPNAKSSQGRMKEKSPIAESVSKENLVEVGSSRNGNPSSRKSKHRRHGKERHKSPRKSEDNEERLFKKSNHRHGKHKARHRADDPVSVAPQAPAIQDFLL
ncbi:AP-3 complex subunit delta-like [Aristolochia californica]|uniref:AP-3 complex subunit delta-like n=1 Tax=Aristolochia californica TaxID=171875 RepID=UPI0035D55560